MEIREFAQTLLFGTTLESKLLEPSEVTDERPGSGLEPPAFPGRPPGLRRISGRDARDALQHGTVHSRPEKPLAELRKLESETDRALLLHHFANHELLALELMALVLLRFPEAPAAFRASLVGTIQEEQKHLRLYRKRMNALGLDFGDAPVNAFFWSHISAVASPLDFVVRMSMTFEQANLDYADHYARAFARLGDTKTAAVLELVLKEEIGHVKNGLHWFHEWREEPADDWSDYRRLLPETLTPARARGMGFNEQARLAAGLSPEFIRELRVYSHSRGRPPTVFLFHPACEEYIARGAGASLNANIRLMTRDLSCLPLFAGASEDVVLVHRRPSSDFLMGLREAGIGPPEFIEVCMEAPGLTDLGGRKLGDVRAWGWSPASWKSLRPLMDQVVGKTGELLRKLPGPDDYPPHLRRVFARSFGRDTALKFAEPELAPDAGEHVSDAAELHSRLADFARANATCLVKSMFSSSGRDKYRITPEDFQTGLPESTRNRLHKLLERQGGLIIEPLRARRLDLSAQIQVEHSGRVRVLGVTRMITDEHGRWLGSVMGNLMDDLTAEEKSFTRKALNEIRRAAAFAGGELSVAGYTGPAGTDAFVYQDPDHDLRLRPIVEINPRFTMGRLALELGRRIRSGRTGVWVLLNQRDVREAGYTDFAACVRDLQKRFPLRVEKNPSPFIMSGALPTNDPAHAESVLSILMTAPDINTAREHLAPFQRIALNITRSGGREINGPINPDQ